MSLNNNFKMAKMLLNKKPEEKKALNSSKCKRCGASEINFVINNVQGDVICTKCGLVQDRIMKNHSPMKGNMNGKIFVPKVIIEENQKIRLLVMSFFNVMFGGMRNNVQAGRSIAASYQDFKTYRARYVTKTYKKGEHITSLKGLHMPTIICCMLYCTLNKQRQAMPLSVICSIINKIIVRSSVKQSKVVLAHAFNYKDESKYGLVRYFQLRDFGCQNAAVPGDFTTFICNTLFGIQSKEDKNNIRNLANEIFKEYSDRTSPAKVASMVLHHVGKSNKEFDHSFFGLTQKETDDFQRKLLGSKNVKVQQIIKSLGSAR